MAAVAITDAEVAGSQSTRVYGIYSAVDLQSIIDQLPSMNLQDFNSQYYELKDKKSTIKKTDLAKAKTELKGFIENILSECGSSLQIVKRVRKEKRNDDDEEE